MLYRLHPLVPLAADKDDRFFHGTETTPTVVDGVGQMVYWKDCAFLCVFRTWQTKPWREIQMCDGQAIDRVRNQPLDRRHRRQSKSNGRMRTPRENKQ